MECTIYLAETCNLACKYCYEGEEKRNILLNENMLDKTIEYIMKCYDGKENIYIVFLGGEPLLNKNMIFRTTELIRTKYSHIRKHVSYSLTTNATLIDNEIVELIKKENINLSISIDGDRYTHNLNRRSLDGIDKYDIIIGNIYLLKEKKINFSIRMTVTPNNAQFLIKNVKYFYDMGMKTIHIGFDDFGAWENGKLQTLDEQMDLLDSFYLEIINKSPEFIIDLYDYKFSTLIIYRKPLFCSAGRNAHFVINSIGEIYPCGYVLNKEKWKIGNVNQGISRNIFFDSVRNSLTKKNKCETCEIAFTCIGRKCGFLNLSLSGFLNEPSKSTCKWEKMLFKHNLKVINELYRQRNNKIMRLYNFAIENDKELTKNFMNIITKER